MKSTLCLAFSLSTFISTSLSLPSHAYIRNGHALAMKHSRAIKEIITPLVERSEVEDLNELEKRSIRRFGTLDFGHQLQSRSNEDEEDDSEDGEDDEDCDDDETDDENNTDTSSTSNDTTQNTPVPTYTVTKPKKVPSWTAPEPTKKETTPEKQTTPTYTASEKKQNKVAVSAGVSVSTGSSGAGISVSTGSSGAGISIGASTYNGKATFFSQGGVAGACGTVHQDSDYVVAIDSSMYEGGKFCGKKIAVTRVSTGKTIHCIGADECPGCPSVQSLDLSIGAFNALGTPDEGVFDIKWEVVS